MKTKTCFVIMPFSKTNSCSEYMWTNIYEKMIKPAVTGSKLGFTCERAKLGTGNIIKDILNNMNTADIVVADLTDMNSNVFYELGVRHTLRSRTILITQDMQYVPSDLRSYWVVAYKKGRIGNANFKREIRGILREMIDDPEKPDNPVADFLKETNRTLLSQDKSTILRKLTALCSELSRNIAITEHLIKELGEIRKDMKNKKVSGLPVVRFNDSCIDLIISTHYIALPEKILREIDLLERAMLNCNRRIDFIITDEFRESAIETLEKLLPEMMRRLSDLLKEISKIRIDFLNDNYQEPDIPAIILAEVSHKDYLSSTPPSATKK